MQQNQITRTGAGGGSKKMSKDKGEFDGFVYPGINLKETVLDGKGCCVPRYGRMRDANFRHLGAQAPFRADGALFDRCDPLAMIMPVATASVQTVPLRSDPLQFSHAPGVGAYGN